MDAEELRATVEAARAGTGAAFEELLAAYGPRLYAYFLRSVGNHHDAEDLLGDVALRLVRDLKRYTDQGRFDHWLFRIAANLVRDRNRRLRSRPPAGVFRLDDSDGPSPADNLPGRSVPADGRLLADESFQAVRKALNTMDESTRQMILLRHFGELSFKDIAELCQCPIGTALAKVHRGIRTLRRLMESEDATH